MKFLNKACDALLSVAVPKITARAACYETTTECIYMACGNGGKRRCCRTCQWRGDPCRKTSCGSYSCGICTLP